MDESKELDKLTYIISHDLQEPLRMIKSYVQLLDKKYNDKLDNDAKQYIQFAVDGTNRLKMMMDGLLEYSRLGRNGINKQAMNLKEVTDDIVRSFKKKYHGSYSIAVNFQEPFEIIGDKALISKLLFNITDNALKFNGANELKVELNAEDKPDEWIISVTDDGIGIDRDYHEKIFVIFQKLHINNEKDGLNGTGMGLAICEKIVKLHNGKIWVNSDVDKGAAFYVSIPKRITG